MKKITSYAKFNYAKEDGKLVDILSEYLNNNAEKVFNFFDPALPRELVNINIVPTKKEYDEIVQKRKGADETPKWEIGNWHDDVIEYVSLHDYVNTHHAFSEEEYDENLEKYKKTILHEYVHYVLYLYSKRHKIDTPLKYLNEGIAQYLSGQRDNIKITFNYTLDDILNSSNCYEGWYLLTKYIIEKYGKDYFLKLFENQKAAYEETQKLFREAKEFYSTLNNSDKLLK